MPELKFTAEKKMEIIEAFQAGEVAWSQLREVYGMNPNEIYRWISKYEANGIAAFARGTGNASYSQEFKLQCVKAYLSGAGSVDDIVAKYNISGGKVLRSWIKRYNANKGLEDYNPKREVYMAVARRKTTLEERKEIAEYCIAHGEDYKGAAGLYAVSYSQVYSWVKKYLAEGEEGLTDRRGHHKTDDEVDELERLRRENLRLKRQLEDERRTIEILKKRRNSKGCEAGQGSFRIEISNHPIFPRKERI